MGLLMTAEPVAAAGGGIIMILYIVVIVAFMYFIMIRPQKKEQKRVAAMLADMSVQPSLKVPYYFLQCYKYIVVNNLLHTIHLILIKNKLFSLLFSFWL